MKFRGLCIYVYSDGGSIYALESSFHRVWNSYTSVCLTLAHRRNIYDPNIIKLPSVVCVQCYFIVYVIWCTLWKLKCVKLDSAEFDENSLF